MSDLPAPPWRDYPRMARTVGLVEPAPRRVRGVLAGRTLFDTVRARYWWEHERYPQYVIPVEDVDRSLLATLPVGAARLHDDDAPAGLAGTVHVAWDALDAWFEEDEEVFVHPRNPYTRVDALRSTRHIRVELDGVLLAESRSPVLVFETGLPTRYYLDRTCVDMDRLRPNDTRTACPYKGRTTGYWDAVVGDTVVTDAAWSYAFTTAALNPVAGLVAFLNERLDLVVDGVRLERPRTPFT